MSETKLRVAFLRRVRPWVWWTIGGVIVAVLAGITAVAYASVGTSILRGVTVAGVDVGGRTTLDATHQLDQRWADFSQHAFAFTSTARTATLSVAVDTSTETTLTLATVNFSASDAANRAWSFGRRGSWWQQVRERLSGWLGRQHEMGIVAVDGATLGDQLLGQFADLDTPATNAAIAVDETGNATVTQSANGSAYDYAQAVRQATAQAHILNSSPVTMTTKVTTPTYTTSSTLQQLAAQEAPAFLNRAPLTLTYGEQRWTIDRQQLSKLLGFTGSGAQIRVGFDLAKTSTYLESIAKDVNVKSQNAKFSIVDGKVQEFQASAIGKTLDVLATIAAMQQAIAIQGGTTAAIVVVEEKPLTDTTTTNNLGITELVATGVTNFKGSPTNRRYNLGFGAKLLNGLLIQPGEEFSLIKALGKIDGAHGWKPELVIKGSKIIPEYGGGLCQVATTLFRATLNAGLPITERHNHSLRISYYEPPIGLDATIYEPKPDLRFQNDYATPLLLQTEVDGTLLKFSFYGTKDGRTVDLPTPKVYNKVGIPATKYIEVTDLKPGQKQCQAPGHPGADATATYTVTYADGRQNKQVFQSHYRAIGVICRVGKSTATPKPTTNTNTSTNTNTTTDTNTAVPADTNTAPPTETNTNS